MLLVTLPLRQIVIKFLKWLLTECSGQFVPGCRAFGLWQKCCDEQEMRVPGEYRALPQWIVSSNQALEPS